MLPLKVRLRQISPRKTHQRVVKATTERRVAANSSCAKTEGSNWASVLQNESLMPKSKIGTAIYHPPKKGMPYLVVTVSPDGESRPPLASSKVREVEIDRTDTSGA